MWLLYVKIYMLTIKIPKIFLTHAFTLSQQSMCVLCPESSSAGTSCRASVCVLSPAGRSRPQAWPIRVTCSLLFASALCCHNCINL